VLLHACETKDRSLSDSDVAQLFRQTLRQVKDATELALDKTVTINSIAVPAHFRWSPYLSVLSQAAIDEGLTIRSQQVCDGLNADRLAYNLDSCIEFEIPLERCDIDGVT
jgi:hypothetical protein